MVEWSVGARDESAPPLRVPDGIGGAGQLARVVAASPRPFVLISERELSVLRRGLTKDGWKRSLYLQPAEQDDGSYLGAGVLSLANRWLESEVDIPLRSGHYHHLFCDCGTRLSIPKPLQTAPEYTCPACGRKFSGEKYDGAIRYLQHNRLSRAALSLALVYAIEKDKAYADKAAEILLEYAEAYPGPHTAATTGGIMYQSLCEAVWVIPLAQAYDLIYYSRSLSDADKRIVEEELFRAVAEGLKNCGIGGNWGSWHLSAVGVIGLATKDAPLVRYALDSFRSQIADQLGDDGLWPESAHTYHFYPLSAFVRFAEACHRAGIDIYNWQVRPGKSLKIMFTAPLQYMYPSFRLPAINDGWYDSFLPLDLYEIAHRRWSDPAFAWVLKRGYKWGDAPLNQAQVDNAERFSRTSFYAFLFGRDLPGRSGPPVLKSWNFPKLGICTLRNGDDLMVTLDHGPFLGHGHLDKLSFTLYANDAVLVPDYGTPGYGAGILGWYQGTPAHNTVVVDGRSQERAKDYGLVTHYSGAFVQFAQARASDCYPGVTHTRRILVVGSTCIVSDGLHSEEEHDYDWLMRCEGKPREIGDHQAAEADVAEYPLVQFDKLSRVDGCYRADWKCEKGKLAFAIWGSGADGLVGVGSCPAETAQRSASFFMCRQHARDAAFLAMLVPSRSGEEIGLSRDGCAIKVNGNDWVDHIYVRNNSVERVHGPLQTDGEIAAVRTRDGKLTGIAIFKGSWVRWEGETVLECPAVVDCAEISFKDRGPVISYYGDTAGVVKVKTNARAMRVNGHRAAATNSDGHALLRVTPQMLDVEGMVVRAEAMD